jgi:hypothetical protein
MTKALEQAFREASKLPETEQEALAEAILREVLGDDEWERSVSTSSEDLEELANEAIAEHGAGRTLPLRSGKR